MNNPIFLFRISCSLLTIIRFRDIGYSHHPYVNCPRSPKCSGCAPGQFTKSWSWMNLEDCRPSWFRFSGLG